MNPTVQERSNDGSGSGNQVVSKRINRSGGYCKVCKVAIRQNVSSCETCKEFFEDNFEAPLSCTHTIIKGPYSAVEEFCQCDSCWYDMCKKAKMKHTRQNKLPREKISQRADQNSKVLEQILSQPQILHETGQSLQSSDNISSDFQTAVPGNRRNGQDEGSSSPFDNKQQPRQLQAPPNTSRKSAFISHESSGANFEDKTIDSTSDSQKVHPDFFAEFLRKVFSDGSEVTEETESNYSPVSLDEEIRKFRVKVKQCFKDAKKIKISGEPENDQNTTTATKREAPDEAEEGAQTSSSHVLFPRSHEIWYEQNGQTIDEGDTGETNDVSRETHSRGRRAKDKDIGQGTG